MRACVYERARASLIVCCDCQSSGAASLRVVMRMLRYAWTKGLRRVEPRYRCVRLATGYWLATTHDGWMNKGERQGDMGTLRWMCYVYVVLSEDRSVAYV